MRICDYSSLIFTGNTTVLLILALTTDYWEYRTFNKEKILQMVQESKMTRVFLPFDTDSYFQIKLFPNITDISSLAGYNEIRTDSFYHAPLFLVRRYFQLPDNSTNEFIEEFELDMFQQYGNLFRDCDSLEGKCFITIFIPIVSGLYVRLDFVHNLSTFIFHFCQ